MKKMNYLENKIYSIVIRLIKKYKEIILLNNFI